MGRPNIRYVCLLLICFSCAHVSHKAGGGSYYFAKKSINADKKARHEADMKRRHLTESLEYSASTKPAHRKVHHTAADHAASPSTEASATHDPTPIVHAPEVRDQQVEEKSRFEPRQPYRGKRGDRFS